MRTIAGDTPITRSMRRQIDADNRRFPEHLLRVPATDWPPTLISWPRNPKELWRSRRFLVMIYDEAHNVERLSVMRTAVDKEAR